MFFHSTSHTIPYQKISHHVFLLLYYKEKKKNIDNFLVNTIVTHFLQGFPQL